ncbi:hypothetical protein OPQ81_010273 [Rhizoctonia solani]|nr:hypothetical protein OPQ81_010273 [Rhizoctonia solani]
MNALAWRNELNRVLVAFKAQVTRTARGRSDNPQFRVVREQAVGYLVGQSQPPLRQPLDPLEWLCLVT